MRLASFNLENLDDREGPPFAARLAALRPQLARLRADVLCLQEINAQHPRREKRRRLRALERLLAGTPYARYERAETVATEGRGAGHEPRDRHNLVILSRYPIERRRQIFHDLVAPPTVTAVTAAPAQGEAAMRWDRPALHATLKLDGARRLEVVNVHLRAPRAVAVAGQKRSAEVWRTVAGWAEGYYLAALKRAGQALEVRLFVDRLFDARPEALIAVVGDFNAEDHEVPLRLVRGEAEDTGNPELSGRGLIALERGLALSQRFSVIHRGRRQMLDHVLASPALLAFFRRIEVHNEALGDELVTPARLPGAPESFHAPVVAEFALAPPKTPRAKRRR